MNQGSKSVSTVRIMVIGFVACLFLAAPLLLSFPRAMSQNLQNDTTNNLSNHWLSSKNCYRDELNQSDTDYNNCWMDNAGKILVMSATTGDATDLGRSLQFIESYMKSGSQYYLPELSVINGSVSSPIRGASTVTISNGLVELTADNATVSHFDQLAIGTSYTGNTNLAYLGGDRIWYCAVLPCSNKGASIRSNSSNVFLIPNGFSKRSLFQVGGNSYYVYVNATLASSAPYANITTQLEPIGSSPASNVEYLFLQAFNTTDTNPFYSGSLYSSSGSFISNLPFTNASGITSGGILLSYSNATNVFSSVNNGLLTGQDAIAIKFGNESIYDYEHWAENPPFNHSWFGPGYHAPQTPSNSLSAPIYSEVYPILHFDYHLANATAKYISSAPIGVGVSPPVSFGFISYGLALDSSLNPSNLTLQDLAKGYWNYYYDAYSNGSINYGTPYARSINLFAIAGFKLYGCNSTVESFARNFIGNTSGSAIEEYGWGTAALYELKSCTGTESDSGLYDSFVNSFGISQSHFIQISDSARGRTDFQPSSTFGFAEAASGLMLGGIPYNNSIVLRAMDAVYQSNVSGTVLNTPYSGDLANTETLPDYMLATYLFQSEMRNETGFWITSISNLNVTAINFFANGTLSLSVYGVNGRVSLANNYSEAKTFSNINGNQTFELGQLLSSSTTARSSVSSTATSTTASSSTSTTTGLCQGCGTQSTTYILIAAVVVLAILSAVLGYRVARKRKGI